MTRLPADYLADAEKRARRFMGQWTGTSGALAADVIRILKERNAILQELDAMTQQLEDANARLRDAIAARREAVAAGKPAEQWYDAVGGCCDGGKCHTAAIDERGPMVDVDEHIAEDDERTPDAGMTIDADYILRGQRELETAPDDIRWTGDSLLAKPTEPRLTDDAEHPAERLLLDALAVIRDRRPKYGGPKHHFRRTIGMINAAFADVLKRPLTEADWAQFMLLDKVARYNGPNKTSDGPIDLAGYAACLAEVEADPDE
jgi:hypothetical protein